METVLAECYGASSIEADKQMKEYIKQLMPATLAHVAPKTNESTQKMEYRRVGTYDMTRPSLGGEDQAGQLAVKDFIEKQMEITRDEVLQSLTDELVCFDFDKLSKDDMKEAVELYLIGGFVLAEFNRHGGMEKISKMSLEKPIIKRLAQEGDWGILTGSGQDHQNRPRGRLVWKGKENHYRALVYFFRWLRSRYHPFDLLGNVQHLPGGEKITAESMKRDIHRYIDKISHAIDSTRTKGLFGSTWDWQSINTYMGVRGSP